MNKLLCLICLLLISACSTTKVVLNQRYISQQQSAAIVQKLESAGYEVVTNDYAFPQTITQSTLLYSLSMQDQQAVFNVQALLSELGWPVDQLQPLNAGNQWYSVNSLGVYLLPDNVDVLKKEQGVDLPGEYKTEHCEKSGKLTLKQNKQYKLTLSGDMSKEQRQSLSGTWRITDFPYVELRSDNREWFLYFEVAQQLREDQLGKIAVTAIKPVEDYWFKGCQFVSGQRL
ncbi:hypothetical protein [Neptunicella marina]|uniref:Lipoprotein n=1 Tax=Neptunicella marina TaxID=2125989 RepID=A0A8J6IUF0_9ALTE|nr:hypothetical protein [Neptunicella marina]MBC3766035.1 hypothetical protein [Neptunicella marina]